MTVVERLCLLEVLAKLLDTISVDDEGVQMKVTTSMDEFSRYQLRESIFTKQHVIRNAKTMAPATWWTISGKHLPNICRIAQILLSQPASASAAERNWSIYGTIKSKVRNRLSHEVSNKLVYAHEALHLRQKLQDAKYIQHA
eukprot:6173553-Pleurochrysis_carterae.AAC.1